MASTSKNSQSSEGEASEVKETVTVQSETIKNINEGDCAGDAIPNPNVSKKITLISSDGEVFEVEEKVAVQSVVIKNMIEDCFTENGIPIPNYVAGKTLSKVLEYCKKHVASDEVADVQNWDAEFSKNLDQATLYDLLWAADFLNIKSLLDLLCEKFIDMIKGKTPDEIREMFNIKNDFTPEEEAKLISENGWALQKERDEQGKN